MHGVAVLCLSFRLRCADLLRRSNLNGHHISLLFMTQKLQAVAVAHQGGVWVQLPS